MNRPVEQAKRCGRPLSAAIGKGGFTLVEVLVSMVVLSVGVLAVTGAFHYADHGLHHGVQSMRALAMAESRIEAKRAAPWEALLRDDVDGDGLAETAMRDDGTNGDAQVGDGVYSASLEDKHVRLVWTVRPNPTGPLWNAGSAVIVARATYTVGRAQESQIQVTTLRANPRDIGRR